MPSCTIWLNILIGCVLLAYTLIITTLVIGARQAELDRAPFCYPWNVYDEWRLHNLMGGQQRLDDIAHQTGHGLGDVVQHAWKLFEAERTSWRQTISRMADEHRMDTSTPFMEVALPERDGMSELKDRIGVMTVCQVMATYNVNRTVARDMVIQSMVNGFRCDHSSSHPDVNFMESLVALEWFRERAEYMPMAMAHVWPKMSKEGIVCRSKNAV